MDLRFPGNSIVAGTVSAMRGSLGPNTSSEPATITFSGTVSKGVIYRSVIVEPGGTCEVSNGTFECTITLQPGESANIDIRLFADALNAPENVRQQFALGSSLSSQANTSTATVAVTRAGDDDDAGADIAAFTLDMTKFPGAFVPLLALLLFALAATETERRRRERR